MCIFYANCEHFDQDIWTHAQRFAPHADSGFTGEEVVTLYLAGTLDKQRDIRAIHDHARDYGSDGFPASPDTERMCGASTGWRTCSRYSWSGFVPRGRPRPTSA